MERLTTKLNECSYITDETKIQHDSTGFCGEAINKLSLFEDVYDDLIAKQDKYIKQLEKLRAEEKAKTVQFKQLLANKLLNANIIILLESYGINK